MLKHQRIIKSFLIILLGVFSGCMSGGGQKALDDHIAERVQSQAQIKDQWSLVGDYYESPELDSDLPQWRLGILLTLTDKSHKTDKVPVWGLGQTDFGEITTWRQTVWTWIEHPQRVGLMDLDLGVTSGKLRIHKDDLPMIRDITWSLVTPIEKNQPGGVDAITGPQVSVKNQALDSFFATNGVISREEWNARSSDGCGLDTTARYRMAVHHTAGQVSSNGDYAAKLRSTQSYHMDTRGWCDIGYHFLVTYDGATWEGRPAAYRGAHVGNQNSGNIGISFIGCFHDDEYCEPLPPNIPSDIMITNGGDLIGLISEHYDITVDEEHVKGHRDHTGASTSCPGEYLYEELAQLRSIANGNPIEGNNNDSGGEENATGTIIGVVWDLSITEDASDSANARITNATVSCSCGESVSVTSNNASWSFELPVGTYTITASAPGYEDAQAAVTVIEDQDVWNSFGLMPLDDDTGGDGTMDAGIDNTDSENSLDSGNEGDDQNSGGSNINDAVDNTNTGVAGLAGEPDLVLVPAQTGIQEDGCSCSSHHQSTPELMMAGLLLGPLFIIRRKR